MKEGKKQEETDNDLNRQKVPLAKGAEVDHVLKRPTGVDVTHMALHHRFEFPQVAP